MTLPFQDRFARLDDFQESLYLVLLASALLTTTAVMTPVAVHRRITGLGHKERVVAVAETAVTCVMVTISVLLVGIAVLVSDLVVHRALACTAGAVLGLVLIGALVVLPHRLAQQDDDARISP